MSRFLRVSSALGLFAVAVVAACSDDDPVIQNVPTTATTTDGGGGTTPTTTVGGGGAGGVVQGGGGSGGGGAPPMECMGPDTGAEDCDGELLELTLGTDITLCGDISASADNHQDFYCPGASASGDRVYDVQVLEAGTLKIQVRADLGSTLNPTMFIRAPGLCGDPSQSASGGCWDFFDTDHEEFAFHWDPATFLPAFHLFIDGGLDADGMSTSGAYALDISLTAPACGDGVLNPDEDCDDGNTVSGDGCTSTCLVETTSLFDECPGEPAVLVGNPASLTLSANTVGNSDDYAPTPGGSCGNIAPGGRDRVYRVTPDSSGTLTATVGLGPNCTGNVCETQGGFDPGCWDYVLWATGPSEAAPYPECGDNSLQLGCSDSNALGPEALSFPVEGGKSYFIVVDGYGDYSSGAFNLCLELN